MSSPVSPADIEDVHHQPFRQAVAPDGPAPLFLPLLAEIDPPLLHLDIGEGSQFLVGGIVSRHPDLLTLRIPMPLLLHRYPQGFQDLFRSVRQFHMLLLVFQICDAIAYDFFSIIFFNVFTIFNSGEFS